MLPRSPRSRASSNIGRSSTASDTLGDAFSYGVSFLRETGYFRREDRFWTDQDFPEAKAVRDRINRGQTFSQIISLHEARHGATSRHEALEIPRE